MLSMYGLKMRQMNDLRSGDQSEMKVNKSCRYKWCCMVFTVDGHKAQGVHVNNNDNMLLSFTKVP